MLNTDLKKLVAQYGAHNGGPSNVLIVDDERPNLMVLRGFLDADYTVHEALSGRKTVVRASARADNEDGWFAKHFCSRSMRLLETPVVQH